jgi:RecA-family ATPase
MRDFQPKRASELFSEGVSSGDLVPGLVPLHGVTILTAAPKVGKSYFANHLAACVQGGDDFLGMPLPMATRVLYLDRESTIDELQGRHQALERICSQSDEVRFLRDRISIVADVDALIKCVRDGLFGLVVIDTLATVIVGLDENDAGAMSGPIDALRRLEQETGAAVLLVAHSQKSASHSAVAAKTRGSNAITALASQLLVMAPMRGGGGVRLEVQPRLGPPYTRTLRRGDDGLWVPGLREVA